MRQLDALGFARRAGGVEERGDVARVGRHSLRQWLGSVDLDRSIDHEVRPRVLYDVVDLAPRHLRVHRRGDCAGSRSGEAQQHLLVAVRGRDHHRFTRLDALCDAARPSVHALGRLVEGHVETVVGLLDHAAVAVDAGQPFGDRAERLVVSQDKGGTLKGGPHPRSLSEHGRTGHLARFVFRVICVAGQPISPEKRGNHRSPGDS